MESTIDQRMLYQVADCPSDYGPVFPLKMRSGEFFFFAPCCGVAWPTPPGHTLDQVLTLSDFAVGYVELPARHEVLAAGFAEDSLTEWLHRYWAEDIPIGAGSTSPQGR